MKLKQQQCSLREVIAKHAESVRPRAWGYIKICVRNYSSTAARNQRREVTAWLTRLSIPFIPDDFEIGKCAELATNNESFQIIVDFRQVRLKLELLSKFAQLREHENTVVNRLVIVDPMDTRSK